MAQSWVPATQLLQDKVPRVWKTTAWWVPEGSGGHTGSTRELRKEKNIGVSGSEQIAPWCFFYLLPFQLTPLNIYLKHKTFPHPRPPLLTLNILSSHCRERLCSQGQGGRKSTPFLLLEMWWSNLWESYTVRSSSADPATYCFPGSVLVCLANTQLQWAEAGVVTILFRKDSRLELESHSHFTASVPGWTEGRAVPAGNWAAGWGIPLSGRGWSHQTLLWWWWQLCDFSSPLQTSVACSVLGSECRPPLAFQFKQAHTAWNFCPLTQTRKGVANPTQTFFKSIFNWLNYSLIFYSHCTLNFFLIFSFYTLLSIL